MKRRFRLGGSLVGYILLISLLLTSCIQGGDDIGGVSGSLGESDNNSGSYVTSSDMTDEITSEDITTSELETPETTEMVETTGQGETSGTDGTSAGGQSLHLILI